MKFLFTLILMLLGVVCYAQDVAAISPELQTIITILGPFLAGIIIKYPVVGTIIGLLVKSRLIIKPIMSLIISLSGNFPQMGFLEKLRGYSDSNIYKTIAFILDYLFSLKLPKKVVK